MKKREAGKKAARPASLGNGTYLPASGLLPYIMMQQPASVIVWFWSGSIDKTRAQGAKTAFASLDIHNRLLVQIGRYELIWALEHSRREDLRSCSGMTIGSILVVVHYHLILTSE